MPPARTGTLPVAVQRANCAGRFAQDRAGAGRSGAKCKVRECGPQPEQYLTAERAFLKKREAIF